MTVINRNAAPAPLDLASLVLEPGNVPRDAVARTIAGAGSAGRTTTTLKGDCLEFVKLPPTAGMVFRLATEATQKRYRRWNASSRRRARCGRSER